MAEKKRNPAYGENKKQESSVSTAENYAKDLDEIKMIENKEKIDKDSVTQTDNLTKEPEINEDFAEKLRKAFKDDFDKSVLIQKEEIKRESQEIKKDFLTIFGLFASFVTFLSIEVQVFKNKDNIFELIGISSISLSFVMFFAIVINDIAKDKNEWKNFIKPTYIFNLFFAVLGMIFLYIGGTTSINRLNIIEQQSKSDSININNQKLEIEKFNKKVVTMDSLINIFVNPKAPKNRNEN